MKNQYLKEGEYYFEVLSSEPLEESRRLAIIHDWIAREKRDAFRKWSDSNPSHGLSEEEIEMKKNDLFHQVHSERHIMIAHMEIDPPDHDPTRR